MLLLLGLFHALSDLAAGYLVTRLALDNPGAAAWAALWYNGLAFALQPLVGWFMDNAVAGAPTELRRRTAFASLGLFCTTAGLPLAGINLPAGLGLAGIGSALLHTAGGSLAIQATPGRAAGPGLFAAPGVAGLALGSFLAAQGVDPRMPVAVFAGLAIAVCMGLAGRGAWPGANTAAAQPGVPADLEWAAILITGALAVRSAAWNVLQIEYSTPAAVFLGLALAAALGKALGGRLADRVGWSSWNTLTTLAAAPLLALAIAGKAAPPVLWGAALLLQSAIPLHLAALGRLLPTRPALAAGLGLGLSVALGGLPLLAGLAPQLSRPLPALLLAGLAALPLLPVLRLRFFRSQML